MMTKLVLPSSVKIKNLDIIDTGLEFRHSVIKLKSRFSEVILEKSTIFSRIVGVRW